jgi:hypothetical protein
MAKQALSTNHASRTDLNRLKDERLSEKDFRMEIGTARGTLQH